ncbi:MAG TPA: type II CAAX endopeptidase family protein [Phenylobacterium sp.]
MGQGIVAARFPFLVPAAGGETPWRTALLTLVFAGLAGAAACFIVALLVLVIGAAVVANASHLGFSQAWDLLTAFGRQGRTLQSYGFELCLAGLSSFAGAFAFLLVAARLQRRKVASFLTTAPRFRWRAVAAGLLVFFPVVGMEIGIERLTDPTSAPGPLFWLNTPVAAKLVYAATAAACLWLAALSEEMIFRGWLLQQTAAFTKRVAVILAINGVLFSLAHFDPSPGAFVVRMGLGMAWAWIVLRTGGVEFAAGAHFANNLGIALLSRPVSLEPPKAQAFDLAGVATQIGSVVLLVVLVEVWRRRRESYELQNQT